MSSLTATDKQRRLADWVRAHTSELRRFARNRVKDPDVADDLVQLTFVSAWETLDRFAGESSPRTWLFAILKHKLADHYRKVYREGVKVSGIEHMGDTSSEAGAGYPEDMHFVPNGHWHTDHRPHHEEDLFREDDENEKLDRALRHCLDALPERWRSVVEMKYLKDTDSDAIREAMGLSETNYWQQMHRAKLKLRACIEERLIRKTR